MGGKAGSVDGKSKPITYDWKVPDPCEEEAKAVTAAKKGGKKDEYTLAKLGLIICRSHDPAGNFSSDARIANLLDGFVGVPDVAGRSKSGATKFMAKFEFYDVDQKGKSSGEFEVQLVPGKDKDGQDLVVRAFRFRNRGKDEIVKLYMAEGDAQLLDASKSHKVKPTLIGIPEEVKE